MVWRRAVTSAATVRHGNLIVHVNDISSIGTVFAELAKATSHTATSCSFYGPQPIASATDASVPQSLFATLSDASLQMLSTLNQLSGVPHDNLRPAMLSCRSRMSAGSVTYINGLNESFKFCRHFSKMKSIVMNRLVRLELNSHGFFQASGFSTLPPQASKFPVTPPGTFVLPVPSDLIDPEIQSWVLAESGLAVGFFRLGRLVSSPAKPRTSRTSTTIACSTASRIRGTSHELLLRPLWLRALVCRPLRRPRVAQPRLLGLTLSMSTIAVIFLV